MSKHSGGDERCNKVIRRTHVRVLSGLCNDGQEQRGRQGHGTEGSNAPVKKEHSTQA